MRQDSKTKDLFDKLSEPTEPNWSTHQRAIFDWIDSGSGNAAVMAVAGAGKTTTLFEAINRTPEGQSVLAIAYNKTAGDALKKRVRAGIEASTFHSFCHRQIKRCFPKALLDHEGNSLEGLLRQQIRYGLRGDARKLIGLAKNIGVGVLQENTSRVDNLGDIDASALVPGEDAILCRRNAPLVSFGLELLAQGRPVRLRRTKQSDLTRNLKHFIDRAAPAA